MHTTCWSRTSWHRVKVNVAIGSLHPATVTQCIKTHCSRRHNYRIPDIESQTNSMPNWLCNALTLTTLVVGATVHRQAQTTSTPAVDTSFTWCRDNSYLPCLAALICFTSSSSSLRREDWISAASALSWLIQPTYRHSSVAYFTSVCNQLVSERLYKHALSMEFGWSFHCVNNQRHRWRLTDGFFQFTTKSLRCPLTYAQ